MGYEKLLSPQILMDGTFILTNAPPGKENTLLPGQLRGEEPSQAGSRLSSPRGGRNNAGNAADNWMGSGGNDGKKADTLSENHEASDPHAKEYSEPIDQDDFKGYAKVIAKRCAKVNDEKKT